MDLVQKFQHAAESTTIEMPGMAVNKKYPILFADSNSHPFFSYIVVTLILGLLGDTIAACTLPPAYSQAFTKQDIADIHANPAKYQLIYRKKNKIQKDTLL
jgi:hypothetical protein